MISSEKAGMKMSAEEVGMTTSSEKARIDQEINPYFAKPATRATSETVGSFRKIKLSDTAPIA